MKKGNYFGTEIDNKWWRRYRGPTFFARGNGQLSMTELGIEFLRKLTKQPLVIKWEEITSVDLGRWHAGRWGGGWPVLKITFLRDSQQLTAGFTLTKDPDEMNQLAADIRKKTGN